MSEIVTFIRSIANIMDTGVIYMPTTTVAVSKETKEMLRKMGEKGESYDSIIRTLVEEVSWKRLDDRWNKILAEEEFIPLDDL